MQRDEGRHDFAFIAGVIVGAITGALATLALTPLSGPETREKLREHAGDLAPVRERAAKVAGAAQQRVASVAGSAQHMVEIGRDKAAELAAKASLPIPGRQGSDQPQAVANKGETDSMMAENPSRSSSSGSAESLSSHSLHSEDPAEGPPDVPPRASGSAGADQATHATGSGRTPHASDPAEGRTDVPLRSDKPESGTR